MAIVANNCSLYHTRSTLLSCSSVRRSFTCLPGLHFHRRTFQKQPEFATVRRFNSSLRLRKPYFHVIRSFKKDDAENNEDEISTDSLEIQMQSQEDKRGGSGSSFLAKLAIALGIAATVTVLSVYLKRSDQGSSLGIQCVAIDSSASSVLASAPSAGFTFKAFGYNVVLPEYPPGWIYFWLLMAAGCGLFISEEALNIWVGISIARKLTLDATWSSFVESLSRNSPYIISTVLWVYWGVCISDMVPFYIGKFFSKFNASEDVYSRLGIDKEKAVHITNIVQKYGNLTGFVERFSIGVRNPTAFLAGALGISPDCFFVGVCFGGLFTLPIQLAIGFLLRERPVFAVASVAAAVGIWTVFPYAVAALTALFFYLRGRHST